jgi:NAD(P)-dependent dehydrogenase (short-subunit alcohol dehydrogenase family)
VDVFEGKSIIVTGAASGIGRAASVLFARHGGRVIVSDVDAAGGEETAAMIGRENRGEARFVPCDIADESQVRELVAAAVNAYGRLDCACNNAGIEGEQSLTHECANENWDRIMGVNLRGTWLCMKHEIPQMLKTVAMPSEGAAPLPGAASRAAGGGCAIVNISSIAGLIGLGGIAAYCASKHGMNGLTKAAAIEYAPRGIRVNSICPGAILTPMIHRFTHHERKQAEDLTARHPIGRMGTPEEVAEAIIWLCSDAASFVTGQTLAVDGGYVAQ